MAESAVSFLLDKLTSLLVEEATLLSGVREEVGFVKDELQSMKAFLQKADAVEDEDPEIKAWVKQVRQVAYDTEDIIDEFLYRFEHPRRPGFYGRLCQVARTIKTLKARRRMASKLQTIKSRITSIPQRHRRYHDNASPSVMVMGSSSSSATKNVQHELRRADARLLVESQLIGIERNKQKLVRLLLKDVVPTVKVIAVVGMGGLGKTTLVNQVYRDAKVKRRFQHRVWVTVSQSFNPHELLIKMIEQLFKGIKQPVPKATYSKDTLSLKEEMIDFLGDKKYLVVLDDLWGVDSWDDLKQAFPADNNRGSRLIVTTRKFDLASTTTRDLFGGDTFPLKPLSSEESWKLFCAKTFQGNMCPHHLEEISKHILKRCMGLPLAIVTISGVLATKDTSKINEWERVRRCLGVELDNNDQLKNMKKILSLSFNDLSYQLKSCFLYLSLFPEDFVFYKDFIIKYWKAQGFLQERENTTLEEVGEVYFNELCNRSLIQLTKEELYEGLNEFQVHDLVREIMIQKSKDQNFAAIASEDYTFLSESVRHLSVCTTLEILQGDQYNFSRLRTLLLPNAKGSISSISISEFFSQFGGLRLLRVLDCTLLPLDKFPECITKLYNLRYLSLAYTKVASIPHSIRRLQNLEFLNLRETLVEELPIQILLLRRLHHIEVFHAIKDGSLFENLKGVGVPKDIGKLRSLQYLNLIQANEGGVDLMSSLGNLKQLRRLGIQKLGAEHGPSLRLSLEKLSNLRELLMETREEAEILDMQDVSSPPRCLQQLFMHGRMKMLPHWMPKLSSLVRLVLRWSKLQVDPLQSLQALPNLQVLYFEKAYDGEELCFKAGGFQMLKDLRFCSLARLRQVNVEQRALPCLEKLWLDDCKLLEEVPKALEFLTHLNEVVFINMGDEFLTRLSSSSRNSDLSTAKHVPKVLTASRDAAGLHSWKRIFHEKKKG